MTNLHNSTLSIIGAGSVGSSLAYAALIRNSARHVVLYDVDQAKVDAQVLDLAHGTLFTGTSRVSGGSEIECIAGSDVVAITAGAKQKPGQSRRELAAVNAKILQTLMPLVVEYAPNAVVLLVTNPCDVLTVVADALVNLPQGRLLSSGTVLDSARLRWLLAETAGVAAQNVHAVVVGEHGDSEFPLWSGARIGETPLAEWKSEDGERIFSPQKRDALAEDVLTAAYRIIRGKGATNYAIGLSAARIVEAILQDEQAILPVSTVLHGYRDIEGIALSVPSLVGAGGVQRVLDVAMDEREVVLLHRSADAIAGALRNIS